MADWYNKTLTKIGKSLLDLNSLSAPKIIPMTSGYVFNQTHEFLSDLTPAERVAAGVALNNVVFGNDLSPTDYNAYWTMDDAQVSGSTLLDLSGNSHTATMVNTPTTGEIGQKAEAVGFNGIDEDATVVNHADFNSTLITVSAWVKTTGSSIRTIFSNWGLSAGVYSGYQFRISSAGKIAALIAKNTGVIENTDFINAKGTTDVGDGELHHSVFTYDGSNVLVYVDGVLETTTPWVSGLVFDIASIKTAIAARSDDQGSTYKEFNDGLIDDLKVFPRVITAGEVRAMYIADGGIGLTSRKDGWLDADDPTIVSPILDDIIEAFIIYNDTGTEATSPIILYSDSSPGLPYTVETTGAIKVQFESSGIAKL